MTVQHEGRGGENPGPKERSGQRRTGHGRRIWNSRVVETPVELDQRKVSRRSGPSRRSGAERRSPGLSRDKSGEVVASA